MTTYSKRMILALSLGGLAGLSGLAGCGGADETHDEHHTDNHTTGHEAPPEPDDGLAIEGLMGTISEMAVSRALSPRMGRFAQCFAERYDDLDVVGGRIRFSFRLKTDGTVKWVFPQASTIGDRQTEACLVDVAQRTRFERPRGGEAEFTWPLAFDAPDDIRPPVNWEPTRAEDAVAAHGAEVRSSCGRGPFIVTAYVNPGGEVKAAGVSTTEQTSAEGLDCVATAVAGWTMPDPGSYLAKVTFELP